MNDCQHCQTLRELRQIDILDIQHLRTALEHSRGLTHQARNLAGLIFWAWTHGERPPDEATQERDWFNSHPWLKYASPEL